MVNFDSITIGLEVEFQVENGSIERGIVRYKGPVNGKPGDWVGVEANRSGITISAVLIVYRYFHSNLFYCHFSSWIL
jgi:hypothetical protein